ncbi:MAG TPA: vanadium-dependent haloperoxidase [Symbiobacteriaceae bacterium]|nr:vanadium-dependent haloperoxidase [Symbiobacteriaceae bacterium]
MRSAPTGSQPIRFTSASPVEPLAGTWRMMCVPNPGSFSMAPPPANDSAVTAAELAELRTLARNRTANDLRQILRWSENEWSVAAHWETLANLLAKRYELSPPAAGRVNYVLNAAIHSALLAGWNTKYQYLRPRPSVLDPGVNPSVIAVPHHPSYPSGHSTVAGAASTVLSQFFPTESAVIHALAQDSGMSRLKAGIHYRSDHSGGLALGRQVGMGVLQSVVDQDGGPRSYSLPTGAHHLTFQEFLTVLDCQNFTCVPPRR